MRRFLLAAFLCVWALGAHAAVYIVRHAEKQNPKMDKSLLSAKGKRRAESLKRVLASVELKAVYCTEYERTRQTAAPAAAAHKLRPKELGSEDVDGLVKALKALPEGEDVLVVGHSDTVPDILKKLGVERKVEIGKNDFDNLFIVNLSSGRPPLFSWLHY